MEHKVAVVADPHCPYEDGAAIELACKIIADYRPDQGIHLGDGVDFYSLSRFDKDPARAHRLQEELNAGHAVNKALTSAAEKAAWIYLKGNHEARLERYMWTHPEIYGLDALDLDSLLDLPEGWRLADSAQIGYVLFTHGARVSKHPGRAVMAELQDRLYQTHIVIGHGHDNGQYLVRGHKNIIYGYEIGCLCHLAPKYRPVNRWTQGLLLVTMRRESIGWEQVIFEDVAGEKVCVWRGKEYRVKGVSNERQAT